MRRFLSRIWIFVLTFGLGISVSSLWYIYTLPTLPEPVEITEPEVTAVFPEARPFRHVMDACGPTSSHHVYQSSDGEIIGVSCERFGSNAAAARALKRSIGRAEIVERFTNFDKGRPSGETVVVVGEKAMELRTDGKSLCVTTASSLELLRKFQRR